VEGRAEALPCDDASFDVVISVFGVIFSDDPEGAIREMLRVVRPGGRVLIAAWLPSGPITTMMGAFARAMATATNAPAPERFAWHDHDLIAEIAGRHNAGVESFDREIQFSGESPETFFDEQDANHPLSIASRSVLVNAGLHESVKREAIGILHDGNEDPDGFRVTSPYRVHELRPN
jgi:SAM-dependent methyltransferase